MPKLLLPARRLAGRVKRRLFPTPEVAAWRTACRAAERTPRRTPGTIELAGYRLRYVDLLTLCPQWHDLFVEHAYRFAAATPTPRILDGGANVGLASLYWRRLYPQARITAYEADPAIAAVLRANLDANGARDVETVQAALWTADGRIEFQQEGSDSGAVANGATGEGPVVTVPSLRLRDELLAEERIDLLKLDVEGAEAAILADCRGALGAVRALLVEIHEWEPARRRTGAIVDLLAEEGFVCALSDLVELPWRPPMAAADSPFPGRALSWVVLARAWRE